MYLYDKIMLRDQTGQEGFAGQRKNFIPREQRGEDPRIEVAPYCPAF
jgi:hypothetical protein